MSEKMGFVSGGKIVGKFVRMWGMDYVWDVDQAGALFLRQTESSCDVSITYYPPGSVVEIPELYKDVFGNPVDVTIEHNCVTAGVV